MTDSVKVDADFDIWKKNKRVLLNRHDNKYLALVYGVDRKICHEGH